MPAGIGIPDGLRMMEYLTIYVQLARCLSGLSSQFSVSLRSGATCLIASWWISIMTGPISIIFSTNLAWSASLHGCGSRNCLSYLPAFPLELLAVKLAYPRILYSDPEEAIPGYGPVA